VQLLSLRNGPTLAQYVPLNTGAAVGVWIALVVSVVALAVGASRRRDLVPVCLGAVWFLLSLVPHVISVPSIGMYGNRYGYCGLFGLALAVSATLACLPPLAERVRSLALAGALVLALMLAAATALEASHWRSNLALYSVDVERDPDNGYALYHLGTALSTDGGCAKALPAFVRATQLAPRYERPWHNVAGCLINLGRAADALTYARRSVELEPHNVRARYNLAVVFAARGDHAAARSELQRALALEPDYTPAQRALAALAATPGTLPAEAPSAQ
jgi:tetratricopeptide (TPR) repeat protein